MFSEVWTWPVHTAKTSWLSNKTSTLCFVFYYFTLLSIILLPGSIKLSNTKHKLEGVSTALSCPDRCALSGRFFLLTEHFKKQGARAVAMAALKERRRSWHPDVCHQHRSHKPTTNPPTDAYILRHQKTIHIQPRHVQLKVFQYSENHSKPSTADLPNTPTSCDIKNPFTALHTAVSHPPPSSSALCTHTNLPTQPR